MLIACPACASEYEIEGVLVGAEGRSVRCAACSETWFVAPEIADQTDEPAEAMDAWETAALDPASVPALAAQDAAPVIDQPMPPPRKTKPLAKKRQATNLRPSPALAAGLALFAILPLALFGRSMVVRAMPQSAGLFAAVGLPVNLRGIDLRDVVASYNPAEGSNPAQLVVEGDLVGVARERVVVSPLEIEIRDAQAQSLHRWTVPASRAALESGETARFRASLSAPPAQGSQVLVRFTDAAETRADSKGDHAEPETHAPAADARHGHH